MDIRLNVKLLRICSVCIALAGITMLCVCAFREDEPSYMLPAGLACSVISNLFNVIGAQMKKKAGQ